LAPITLTTATSGRDQRRGTRQVQAAVAVDRDQVHRHAFAGQALRQRQQARVLDRAHHHALAAAATRGRQRAQHGHVVGLGGAAGEHDLGRLAAQETRHAQPRIGQQPPRSLPGS
jgi:hypothetical protein